VNVACYDIKGGFPQFRRCPECRGALNVRELEYSKENVGRRAHSFLVGAVLPFAHTNLITCTRCGWWSLREYRGEIHGRDHSEDLVVPNPGSTGHHPRQDDESAPWRRVLRDPSCWAHPRRIPRAEAIRLFGSKGKRAWERWAEEQRVDFGNFIRERRTRLEEHDSKYSVREVAKRMGVKASYLNKLERGKKVGVPTADTMLRLAEELHLNLETLLYGGAGNLDEGLQAKLIRLLAQRAGVPT